MKIIAIHETDEEKILAVMEEMKIEGAPVIRVVETAYGTQAIEGCHRLEASSRLGITPIIEIIECNCEDDLEQIIENCDLRGNDEPKTLAEIIDYIEKPEGKVYEF